MTKEAAAKFTSRCSACGSNIHVGDMITYDPQVRYSSRHKTCPNTVVKSRVALNSPGRGALQGRGRSDTFIGERTDIVLGWSSESRGDQSDIGITIKAKDGRFLTCVGVGSHWVSQDEADDFDLVGPRGGFERHWSVTKHYRLASFDEQAACEARIKVKESAKRFQELCDYGTPYQHGEGGKQIISSEAAKALGDRVHIWQKMVGYSLHEGWRVESGLLTFHPVYDDSPYYQIIRYEVMTPEDAGLVRNAPEIK
jgi:hypothetical protein